MKNELLLNIKWKLYSTLQKINEKLCLKKFKKNDQINPKDHYFIFNRCDAIGDAIVSLPFFIALKKEDIKFEVICSEYNEWVLKPFLKTKKIKLKKENQFNKLFQLFKGITIDYKFRKIKKPTHEIFFDCVCNLKLTKKYKNLYCIHCISPISLSYTDWLIKDFYTTFGKKQLIEKYKMFFEENGLKLKIEEYPKEIDEYITRIHNPKIDRLIEKYEKMIIIFIGNKDFRNFNSEQWYKIINIICNRYKDKNILVIDDHTNKRYEQLKNKKFDKNVILIENNYDLWSLMYLAKYSSLVIGIDGGGFNFLQMPTNALMINFYTNHETWKPFSNNEYKKIYENEEVILIKSTTSQNKEKYVLYCKNKNKEMFELFCINNEKIKAKILNNFGKIIKLNLV